MSQDLTERKGTHVVHVRENSDHELDALFKAAMNPSQTGQTGSIPLRMRNLPPSFWKPPEPQRQMQHVKQGSNDSTGYPVQNIAPGNCNTNLQVAHMRAHSSPASLQQTLSTVPQNPGPQPPHHPRQHSCDLTEVGIEPLPPGWEMAKTADGQRYYLNSPSAISGNPPPGSQQSPNASSQNLGPLPPGWEQAITPEGDVYYINHIERTTIRLQQQQRLQSQNTCQQGQGQGQRQMSPQVNSPPGQGQGQGQNRNQANLQYTQLQLEKERLRKRQEEIARQEMLLRLQMQQQQQLKQQQQGETTSQDIAISQANEMTSVVWDRGPAIVYQELLKIS
ncbi:hypothetical protein KUTeg_011686 [Tegillarca granosa]|uniref:WW domain-containing protein n=1 Tax=Tegillarca granosa TaxID=220873 RepID=A0ABQ9F0V4_TEGGR|nr:hypothetical protein KUTeg_011686 [Tegillarca granosa]